MLAKLESPKPKAWTRRLVWIAALPILLLLGPQLAEAASSSRHTVNCDYKSGKFVKTVFGPPNSGVGNPAPPHVFYIYVRSPGEYRLRLASRNNFGIYIAKRTNNQKWEAWSKGLPHAAVIDGVPKNFRWTTKWIRKRSGGDRWTIALRVSGYSEGPQRIALFWTSHNCQRDQPQPQARCQWHKWASGRQVCMCTDPRDPTVIRGEPDSHCQGIPR